MDKVKNYYELLPSNLKKETKLDKNFKKHYIRPCSMICCIGGTGAGKTNSLISFLERKNEHSTTFFYLVDQQQKNPFTIY